MAFTDDTLIHMIANFIQEGAARKTKFCLRQRPLALLIIIYSVLYKYACRLHPRHQKYKSPPYSLKASTPSEFRQACAFQTLFRRSVA